MTIVGKQRVQEMQLLTKPTLGEPKGASMWGRIDVMIALQEDQGVEVRVLYDTGRLIHTVAKDCFKTLGPVDHTIDPSFAAN